MASERLVSQIVEALERVGADHGIDVVDVEVVGATKAPTVRVRIDHADEDQPTISLDEVAAQSEWIGEVLDLIDPFPGAYTLEVSSPGLSRPLRRPHDYERFAGSDVSVTTARRVNRSAIADGRCAVWQGSVDELIFAADWFDAVTAFETVYFWPDLPKSFREIRRVLRPGGTLLICNECSGDAPGDEAWTKKIAGMRIYPAAELQRLLEQAGFRRIQIHKTSRWLCLTAQKPD